MNSAASPRRIDLDWVRIIAFMLLILYHVGMYYVTWGWHIKSPHASSALEPFMLLTNPWRLALLFLVSGAATSFLLAKSTPGGFVKARSGRLLWPLLFGMLVIVPPQSYYEVVEKLQYPGTYLEFWGRYLAFDHSFCKDKDCLILPTWNHLWFVAYLWVYTMLLALVVKISPAAQQRASESLAGTLTGWKLVVLPWLYLALVRILLLPHFPQTHALVDDWYNHALYLSVFAIGFLLARQDGFWRELRRLRWLALLLAVSSYLAIEIYFAAYAGDATPPDALRTAMRSVYALNQWTAIIAALGWANYWSPVDGPVRRYLTEAIFPLYILHQTVIILLARALRDADLPAFPEGLLLAGGTAVICLGMYEIIRRLGPLRPLFGLKRN